MQPRMKNPAMIIPDAGQAIGALLAALRKAGLPEATGNLVHLRASQINGCSAAVAAWREAPYFTDAERAALALTEAATRLSDRSDPVPDEVWAEAAEHYSEQELAALVLWIATANLFNRLNATTKQVAGAWR